MDPYIEVSRVATSKGLSDDITLTIHNTGFHGEESVNHVMCIADACALRDALTRLIDMIEP